MREAPVPFPEEMMPGQMGGVMGLAELYEVEPRQGTTRELGQFAADRDRTEIRCGCLGPCTNPS